MTLAAALLCAVIVGDSISDSEHAYANRTYPGWQLENLSQWGWTAERWAIEGGWLFDSVQCEPDVVSIFLGTNDAINAHSSPRFRRNMLDLIAEIRRRWPDAEVWLSIPTRSYIVCEGIPDTHRSLSRMDREIVILIEQGHAVLGVDHRALRLFVNHFPDHIHPGPGGHEVIYQAWRERFAFDEPQPVGVSSNVGSWVALATLLAASVVWRNR